MQPSDWAPAPRLSTCLPTRAKLSCLWRSPAQPAHPRKEAEASEKKSNRCQILKEPSHASGEMRQYLQALLRTHITKLTVLENCLRHQADKSFQTKLSSAREEMQLANAILCMLPWPAGRGEMQIWVQLGSTGPRATVRSSDSWRQKRYLETWALMVSPLQPQAPGRVHTLYCSWCRRPRTCVSRALGSLRLHWHSLQ